MPEPEDHKEELDENIDEQPVQSSDPEVTPSKETPSEEESEEKEEKQTFSEMVSELLRTLATALIIFVIIKGTVAEARYIPSGSMEPTLNINDRILVEKVTGNILRRKIEHGDIIVFFPPEIETGIKDNAFMQALGGLPFVNGAPVFVKRVVGLPGDRIAVKKDEGVYLNGKLLDESYMKEPPAYNLETMNDICGFTSTGQFIRPYANNMSPIVVPANHLFMMGDNRNNSADSHVWGFLDQNRIVGRSCLVFWKQQWLSGNFN